MILRINEAVSSSDLKDFTKRDYDENPELGGDLPSGKPAQIHEGKYSTVTVTADTNDPSKVSVTLCTDYNDECYSRTTDEKNALKIGSDLSKYTNTDIRTTSLKSIAQKYGLKSTNGKGTKEEYSDTPSTSPTSDSDMGDIPDITYILEDNDVDIATKDEIGSDIHYRTLLKTVRSAERYNYHSDYWGDADSYQDATVELMEEVEPYINKKVMVSYDEGPVTFKLLGVLIDDQYNSISHTRLLVEEIS
jgi:hypothetical protein